MLMPNLYHLQRSTPISVFCLVKSATIPDERTAMSAMNHRRKAPALAKEWFLKIDEGDIFGPVDTASLKEWACDGRVTPGNQISDDRKSWINAEKIPELEMLWMVELGDGSFYGPLNIAALADLIADDAVSSPIKAHTVMETTRCFMLIPHVGARTARA